MRIEGYTCDVCGVQRGESNHWFMSRYGEGYFRIEEWNAQSAKLPTCKHICGSQCATKCLNQTLEQWAAQLAADEKGRK